MTYEEFKSQYPIRLNRQQEEAVRQTEGPVLLLAVPGSGKTTVLVTRLGYMLYCKGIRPERILTVTYTVAATKDMKSRFAGFFGEEHADKLTFRTINGLCAVVIGTYARQKGTEPFALLDDERQLGSVIRDLLARTGTAFPNDLQVKDARTRITYCKNMIGKVKAMQTHYSKLPYLTSFAAIQRLVRYMGYGDYIQEQHGDTAKLDILLSLANQTPTVGQFLLHLRELKDHIENLEPRPDCPFVLSTIHASKGLEYDHVILIDAVDGLLPSADEDEELEEERRLFYVGATRAKKQLEFLCYENKFGEPSDAAFTFVSQFLGEEPKKQPEPERKPLPAKPSGPSKEQISVWIKDYIPGTEVTHKIFGRGLLTKREGTFATISFMEVGIKKVDLVTCLRQENRKRSG